MRLTKKQQELADRQPFDLKAVVEFCGGKSLAKELICELGGSLIAADKARSSGGSDDVEFELLFWNGILVVDGDTLFDIGIDGESVEDHAVGVAYDQDFDATFFLCRYRESRFVCVRYEFKDQCELSAWWLTREDSRG